MMNDADRKPEETALCRHLLEECVELQTADTLAREFAEIIRKRRVEDIAPWIDLATGSDAPVDLRHFARMLAADLAAVRASLTQPWSNGQVASRRSAICSIRNAIWRPYFEIRRRSRLRRDYRNDQRVTVTGDANAMPS